MRTSYYLGKLPSCKLYILLRWILKGSFNVLFGNHVWSIKFPIPIYFLINVDLVPNFWMLLHNQYIFMWKKLDSIEFNKISKHTIEDCTKMVVFLLQIFIKIALEWQLYPTLVSLYYNQAFIYWQFRKVLKNIIYHIK